MHNNESENDNRITKSSAETPQHKNRPSMHTATQFQRVGSAVFYGASSFLIMNINKAVLTVHHFPSANVLAISQISTTLIILFTLKLFGVIKYPDCKFDVIKKIFPLPLFYLGNLCFGLLGTQGLSLPMQTALRRFSILMTMILEIVILKKRQEARIVTTVLVMVFGSLIAASNDMAFSLIGYAYVIRACVVIAVRQFWNFSFHYFCFEIGSTVVINLALEVTRPAFYFFVWTSFKGYFLYSLTSEVIIRT